MAIGFVSQLNAQISELPDVRNYVSFGNCCIEYGDTIQRDKYHPKSAQPKTQYSNENGKIIRRDFYKRGQLKSVATIKHAMRCDTTTYYDYKTKNDVLNIIKTLADLVDGEFVEYHTNGNIKSKGRAIESYRVGEWVFKERYGNKVIVNYNDKGQLDGPYKEYYFDVRDSTYIVTVDGQYGVQSHSGKYGNKEMERRVGTWKFYNDEGELLEIAEYQWFGKEE